MSYTVNIRKFRNVYLKTQVIGYIYPDFPDIFPLFCVYFVREAGRVVTKKIRT